MATMLYLDTARLGRMCRTARRAEQDFAKLASQLGSSLYFEEFLASGHKALPTRLSERLPGLHCWQGIGALKEGLGRFVKLPANGSVHLAGQSRTLITLAAEALFTRCDRVITTDLEWPPYLAALRRAAVRHGKKLKVALLRRQVLSANMDRKAFTSQIVQAYLQGDCDGLFLSDVTNTGVRMPVRDVLCAIGSVNRPRFTVVDGAQALGHRPIDLEQLGVDLYLAGTQKWFGAYYPLRIAFASYHGCDVRRSYSRLAHQGHLFDPLLEFCRTVEDGSLARFGETVNLLPLITAAGALARWEAASASVENAWCTRLENRKRTLRAMPGRVRSAIDESLASAALLINVARTSSHITSLRASPRDYLTSRRITASEPLPGLLRLAMPDRPIRTDELSQLRRAIAALSAGRLRLSNRSSDLVPSKRRMPQQAQAQESPCLPRSHQLR